MNVSEQNRVNADCAAKPKYCPNPKHRTIEVYLLDGSVVIVGAADNNYIYWLSVSDVKDKTTNAAIFDWIRDCDYELLASLYRVLPCIGITYEQLMASYHTSFGSTGEAGIEWETGSFYAKELSALPEKLRQQCEVREADGAYASVLEKYGKQLCLRTGDIVQDYQRAQPIINLIEEEKYLRYSSNPEMRVQYAELCRLSAELYNAYMSEVR